MNWRWRKPPAPGRQRNTPPALPPPSPRPPPAPGPGFTAPELRHLYQADAWSQTCDPFRLGSARALADTFREHFPSLSDDDLGRLLIHVSVLAREYGLNGVSGKLPGTLALAAAELTRLTRTEAPVD